MNMQTGDRIQLIVTEVTSEGCHAVNPETHETFFFYQTSKSKRSPVLDLLRPSESLKNQEVFLGRQKTSPLLMVEKHPYKPSPTSSFDDIDGQINSRKAFYMVVKNKIERQVAISKFSLLIVVLLYTAAFFLTQSYFTTRAHFLYPTIIIFGFIFTAWWFWWEPYKIFSKNIQKVLTEGEQLVAKQVIKRKFLKQLFVQFIFFSSSVIYWFFFSTPKYF